MNKAELIEKVADITDMNKASTGRAVDAVFSAISSSLKQGDQVAISGFGAFRVTHRAAREGRNPRTGEAIAIAASKLPKFKAGKALRDALN